jgi:hypothetical protein
MGKASRAKRDRGPRGERRALVERLRTIESRIDAGMPGWVAEMGGLRDPALRQYGPWPSWCLLPREVPYALALHYGLLQPDGLTADGQPDVSGLQWPGILAGLYAWRQGRGIYRYDPELADAVAESDLPPDIGTDMLFRLPEWGVYVDPAGVLGRDILGFWVHLGWDAKDEFADLRFVLDVAGDDHGGHLELLTVPLGQPSLAEAMAVAVDNANTKADRIGVTESQLERMGGEFNWQVIERAVLLVLYLCTNNADVSNPDRPDAQPRRAMQSRTTEVLWEVGYRIGTALRAARAAAAAQHGGSHAGPAAHLRRAHYHNYWTGPLDGPRECILKWLPPIPVGVGEVLANFHDVG